MICFDLFMDTKDTFTYCDHISEQTYPTVKVYIYHVCLFFIHTCLIAFLALREQKWRLLSLNENKIDVFCKIVNNECS